MTKLSKNYDPRTNEPEIYKEWENSGAFSPDINKRKSKKPFVIMLPLPNITGSLHIGHALQHSITDALIRYHRMLGEPTLWQPGTDHAGIATQNVVEKSLREQKISRHKLGREKFLDKVWQWRDKYGNEIIQQMKRLGASCDWSRSIFTMDENYVAAVHEAFVRYYDRGFIYRGNRIVNWCPRCASVISDLEITHVEQEGYLYTLRYLLKAQDQHIDVATTRPETMLGDTAVAVHPEDSRYQKLIGQQAMLPLVNREIPIFADDRVDRFFGTGAVKVTPAHDPLDSEIGETHKLPVINVIGEDGLMTKEAGKFAGLTVQQARADVVEALKKEKVLIEAKPHTHLVTLCNRCDTPIEPLISRQWFVDMSKLKDETIAVAEQGIVEFFPPRWRKNFLDWMNNVHDWTISRQLWWGQRIPVWWKPGTRGTDREEGNFIVSVEKPSGDWEQDSDVFDTWFSSALWPIATLGWPKNTPDLKTFYPTSVLISARDIIYLWIARMIFSGLNLMRGPEYDNRDQTSRVPFKHVFIHPTVLNKKGQRMSKSLGTGLDPLELIDNYGADATRFGLIFQMSYDNQAIRFDEKAVKSARNFANKIWNIARFLDDLPEQDQPTFADNWISLRSQAVTQEMSQLLNEYKIGEAARALHDFVWSDYADWYVEILKVEGSSAIAREVFVNLLKLLHPFMPHLSELLWKSYNPNEPLISSPWPADQKPAFTNQAQVQMTEFQDIVKTVRSVRSLLNVPDSSLIELSVADPPKPTNLLESLCRASLISSEEINQENSIQFPLSSGQLITIQSTQITQDTKKEARGRLNRELKKTKKLITNQEKILTQMKGKAPQEAVAEKEKSIQFAQEKIADFKRSIKYLT